MVGQVIATKPAWKRRRASENDEELLQMLAGGNGEVDTGKGAGERRDRGLGK